MRTSNTSEQCARSEAREESESTNDEGWGRQLRGYTHIHTRKADRPGSRIAWRYNN